MTATEHTLHSFILKMQAKTKRTIVNLILFCGVGYFAEKYQYYDCEL